MKTTRRMNGEMKAKQDIMKKSQVSFLLLLIIAGALIEDQVEACSCMPSHPQDQFCTSDFVIVARIRKELTTDQHRIYKAKVKKEFKLSEKAKVALKSGRLLTALSGAMCGVQLEIGKVYLITGRVSGLQPYISLCGLTKPWREVTSRQRKGFRVIYSRGCDCKISFYSFYPMSKDKCVWDNMSCQRDHGICLRSPKGQCNWSKSLDLKKCLTGTLKSDALKPKPLPAEPILEKPSSINGINYNSRSRIDELVNTS
ncbi:Tissue inhibitor of metalloproteases [Carabus blaptoides fortunei]